MAEIPWGEELHDPGFEWLVKRLPSFDRTEEEREFAEGQMYDGSRLVGQEVKKFPTAAWHVRLTIPDHRPNACRIFAQTPSDALQSAQFLLREYFVEHVLECSHCRSEGQVMKALLNVKDDM